MELTIPQAAEATYQKWKAEWAVLHPEIPYVLENEHFVEPESWSQQDPLTPVYWCRVTFRLMPGVQYTLGERSKRLYRREANIWVQIFSPVNNGVDYNNQGPLTLIHEINQFLEGEAFSGIDPNGAANAAAVGGDGKWYQYSVTYPVTFYEQK